MELREGLRTFFSVRETVVISKKELKRMYHKEKMSLQDIAFSFETSKANVFKFMYSYGIPRRNQKSKYPSLKEELEAIYDSGYSTTDIAERYGIPRVRVWRLFKELGIEMRNPKDSALLREKTLKKKENYSKTVINRVKSLLSGIELPNRNERKLMRILNKNFPNEWKYIGDGDFWIGDGKKVFNPDFVNKELKIFIELTSFISEKLRKKKEVYIKYGWDCLFLQNKDLENEKLIIDEIKSFKRLKTS